MRPRFEFNPFKLIWRATAIRIAVEMPLEQALGRLRADVPRFRVFNSGVLGHIGSNHIRLANYTVNRRRGRMSPVLALRVVQDLQGTQLVGCLRNPWTARIMLSFWFGGAILIGLAFLALGPSPPANDLQHRLLGGLVPAAMLVFGTLVLQTSQFNWENDERFLTDFVSSRVGQTADVTRRSAPARASAR
jgi:hypothetical protein